MSFLTSAIESKKLKIQHGPLILSPLWGMLEGCTVGIGGGLGTLLTSHVLDIIFYPLEPVKSKICNKIFFFSKNDDFQFFWPVFHNFFKLWPIGSYGSRWPRVAQHTPKFS